jgi:hypothetical protein
MRDGMAHPTLRRSQIALRHDLSPGGYLLCESFLQHLPFLLCMTPKHVLISTAVSLKKSPFSLTTYSLPPLPPLPNPHFTAPPLPLQTWHDVDLVLSRIRAPFAAKRKSRRLPNTAAFRAR